jgi:DNA invertase Pin-like site-specific DNA recombinase
MAPRKHYSADATKAVAYVRVSTRDQKNGAKAQRDAIRRYAKREGLEVVAWAEDLGVSGGSAPADRDGFAAALDALQVEGAGVLLVAKRDRLARDTMHAAVATGLVERKKARIVSADGVSAEDTPEGALMRAMVDAFAAYERAIIRARTKAALAARRDRGQRFTRHAPYGSRWDADAHAVEDAREQRTLARMRALRDEGHSYRAIGETLLSEGHKPRRAASWSITVLRRILMREEAA